MDWGVRIERCLESQLDLEMLSYDTVLMQVAGVISEYHVEKLDSIISSIGMQVSHTRWVRGFLPP